MYTDAAFDLQLGVRIRKFEMVGDILEKISEPPDPRCGDYPNQCADCFLIGKRPWLQMQRVHALNHGCSIMKRSTVIDR